MTNEICAIVALLIGDNKNEFFANEHLADVGVDCHALAMKLSERYKVDIEPEAAAAWTTIQNAIDTVANLGTQMHLRGASFPASADGVRLLDTATRPANPVGDGWPEIEQSTADFVADGAP